MFKKKKNGGEQIMWYTTSTFDGDWYYSYLELV